MLRSKLDYIESMLVNNPQIYYRNPATIQLMAASYNQMEEKLKIPLEDCIRMSTFFLGYIRKPHYGFPEMLKKKDESFINDVKPEILSKFIEKIIHRGDIIPAIFEHQKDQIKKFNVDYSGILSELSIRMLKTIV